MNGTVLKVSADNGPIEEGGRGISLLIAKRFLLFMQPVPGCVGGQPEPAAFLCTPRLRWRFQTDVLHSLSLSAPESLLHSRPAATTGLPPISPPEDQKEDVAAGLRSKA